MKKIFFIIHLFVCSGIFAQTSYFKQIQSVPATAVKNQSRSGTCWCFSTTSLVESQCIKNNVGEFDISEMFTVRNIYIEKAKNYLLRNGKAQFDEGGLGHDLIHSIATYGAIPEEVYSGLPKGSTNFNHAALVSALRGYLDSILVKTPVAKNWMDGFLSILNQTIPEPPATFDYKGNMYTPLRFAKEVLKFDANDYVNITSFTHQPYYKSFVLQVQDNYSNGEYYNLPISELIDLVKTSLTNGYSMMWDTDVSNPWFMNDKGYAIYPAAHLKLRDIKNPDVAESKWDSTLRQELYERLETQDDHLMHITGLSKSEKGKLFFTVKNSWGALGPYDGYIYVSEAYFAINTVSLVIPKAALSKALLDKLQLN